MAVRSSSAAAAGPIPVAGVLLGRFTLADGRPGDDPVAVREMVDRFRSATVPILSRHRGLPVGYLDTLTTDGRDLAYSGTVTAYDDLVERLRRGPVPVSAEMSEGRWPRWDGGLHPGQSTEPTAVTHPAYRGYIGYGWQLVGVALLLHGESPAARGSLCWIVPDHDPDPDASDRT